MVICALVLGLLAGTSFGFFTAALMASAGGCPHVNRVGIYGDEINFVNGRRLRCLDCGSVLDGPLSDATQ